MHGVWSRGYVEHYNNLRLNCATGYITPAEFNSTRWLQFGFRNSATLLYERGFRLHKVTIFRYDDSCYGVVTLIFGPPAF